MKRNKNLIALKFNSNEFFKSPLAHPIASKSNWYSGVKKGLNQNLFERLLLVVFRQYNELNYFSVSSAIIVTQKMTFNRHKV